MFINEVSSIVGLSRKSIRFYEENGLLIPKRKENDYRIYEEEDIKKLKTIKFLRELGVSVLTLKALEENKITLEEVMEDRIKKIKEEERKYKQINNMCLSIINSKETYHSISIDSYFQKINILNKEGFTLRDTKTNSKKKILGAIISSLACSLFFLSFVLIISYFQVTEVEKMPWFLYYFIIFIFTIPIIGIIYNLVTRIKEINGGEEDEASKY